MIPVQLQPEPEEFDALVRKPGMAWLLKKHANINQPVPSGFDWGSGSKWREILPGLYDSYSGICAFVGCHIGKVTGAKTVEHFKPKSTYPSLAYEWNNYRLMCSIVNGRKSDHEDVIDPFKVLPDTFYIDFAFGSIFPNPSLSPEDFSLVESTIKRLGLDSQECRDLRLEYFDQAKAGDISLNYLASHSPFVHYEARRQGLLGIV